MMDADATLILNLGELGGGTRLTAYLCQKTGKPCRVVQLDGEDIDTDVLGTREWLQANAVTSLNVAGPRESKRPGAYAAARRFLSLLAGEERAVMGSTRPMADTMGYLPRLGPLFHQWWPLLLVILGVSMLMRR